MGPRHVERGRLIGENTALDVDARGAKGVGSPGGIRIGIGLGEDHAGHAGRDERLRARPRTTRVVARLERDDGCRTHGRGTGLGEGVDLGMRRPGAAVHADRNLLAVGVEQNATDPRIGKGTHDRIGSIDGAAHRVGLDLGCHVSASG